ncbi:hypothetical protein J6590_044086 [Homalodisca vitripennis]|nr:hypothetical protein J6590_044086 [Homalodisca vitripennis]
MLNHIGLVYVATFSRSRCPEEQLLTVRYNWCGRNVACSRQRMRIRDGRDVPALREMQNNAF